MPSPRASAVVLLLGLGACSSQHAATAWGAAAADVMQDSSQGPPDALPVDAADDARLPPPPGESRLVFAHYMVCCPTYGTGVEDFKREIHEAQAAGIDGFALKNLFDAADQLGTGVRLFFPPTCVAASMPPTSGTW